MTPLMMKMDDPSNDDPNHQLVGQFIPVVGMTPLMMIVLLDFSFRGMIHCSFPRNGMSREESAFDIKLIIDQTKKD